MQRCELGLELLSEMANRYEIFECSALKKLFLHLVVALVDVGTVVSLNTYKSCCVSWSDLYKATSPRGTVRSVSGVPDGSPGVVPQRFRGMETRDQGVCNAYPVNTFIRSVHNRELCPDLLG